MTEQSPEYKPRAFFRLLHEKVSRAPYLWPCESEATCRRIAELRTPREDFPEVEIYRCIAQIGSERGVFYEFGGDPVGLVAEYGEVGVELVDVVTVSQQEGEMELGVEPM